MEMLREFLKQHPAITHGVFRWYDLSAYYGYVRGYPGRQMVLAHVFSSDISLTANTREEIIEWTYMYMGFDSLLDDDPMKNEKYITDNGTGLDMTYWRANDTFDDSPDNEDDLSPDPDNMDAPFLNYDAFIAAALEDLKRYKEPFVLMPQRPEKGYYIVFRDAMTGQKYGEYYLRPDSPEIIEQATHEALDELHSILADAFQLDPAEIIRTTEYWE